MHPTWNEISETREREGEISNCAGHREEFSSKEKIIKARKVKKWEKIRSRTNHRRRFCFDQILFYLRNKTVDL